MWSAGSPGANPKAVRGEEASGAPLRRTACDVRVVHQVGQHGRELRGKRH